MKFANLFYVWTFELLRGKYGNFWVTLLFESLGVLH